MDTLREILLAAPEGHLDPAVFPVIKALEDEPKALQILKVLDAVTYGGVASSFVMNVLNIYLDRAMAIEGTTYKDLIKKAKWRKV